MFKSARRALRASPVTNDELVATAFFVYSASLLARMARALGKSADAEKSAGLAEEVKARARNVPIDELAAEVVRANADAEGDISPETLAIIERQLKTYRPLFDRLAQ